MYLTAALLIVAITAFLIYGLLRSRKIRFNSFFFEPKGETYSGSTQPLNILHLSDIHGSRSTVQRLSAVEAMSEKLWDFIFITGDLIEDNTGIGSLADVLGRLKARYGKFAVLGNHDYFHFVPCNIFQWIRVVLGGVFSTLLPDDCRMPNDIDHLRSSLESVGVWVLRNEAVEGVTEQGCSYQIFGIDDPVTKRDNPATLYHRKDHKALRLVLIHSLERMEELCPLDPDLVICGLNQSFVPRPHQ